MPEIPPEHLEPIPPVKDLGEKKEFKPSIPPASAVPASKPIPKSTHRPIPAIRTVFPEAQLSLDDLLRTLQTKKEMRIDELAKLGGWKTNVLEKILKLLENKGIVRLKYPASLIQPPKVRIEKELYERLLPMPKGELLEQYEFTADNISITVKVVMLKEDNRPFYFLSAQSTGPYTQAVLEELRSKVATSIPIETIDVGNTEQANKLKEQFARAAKLELSKVFINVSEEMLNSLAGKLLHDLYGLGDLELIAADNNLEEIAINSSKTPITVYHLKYGWMKTNMMMDNDGQIQNLSAQIGRKVGREITNMHPILDAHLISGDRVNATLFPISSSGNTITIRRFARRPWTIVDFIGKEKTMTTEMAAWLWIAMQFELSVLVAGSTASGKTSTLNALCAFIPSHQRIITIEDVRELNLPEYMEWNWVPLTTRNPNPEGSGEVTMLDLLISSLRMRPDRLIVGEMRTRKEAETLFEAMHTGHSVYATIHADSGRQVVRRLKEPPIEIPASELEAIDLILVQHRDRRTNKRRTLEIVEIEEGGISGDQVGLNTVFRWLPRTDEWEKPNAPAGLIRKLNTHTGMTEREIQDEVTDRITILDWLVRKNFGKMQEFGKILRSFYANPDFIKKAAEEDKDPQTLFN
jgi:flagellar protein FlaI